MKNLIDTFTRNKIIKQNKKASADISVELQEIYNRYISELKKLKVAHGKVIFMLDVIKNPNKTWTFTDVGFIETRATKSAAGIGASFSIPGVQGVRFHTGRISAPSTQVMTTLDIGEFKINNEMAWFTGAKYSRKWEWSKLLGVDLTADDRVLIAVENRQKVSGIRYSPNSDMDWRVDAIIRSIMGGRETYQESLNWIKSELSKIEDKHSRLAPQYMGYFLSVSSGYVGRFVDEGTKIPLTQEEIKESIRESAAYKQLEKAASKTD